ncbi:MAG: MCP four helix bundle domain-containing protein [Bacteroidales bacterium]
MGIRLKIVAGFVILASLLVISGLISIFELTKLGNSVNNLINDNYRSIDYSKQMTQSLEKQKKSLIMAINGENEKALALFLNSKVEFEENLRKAANNLTLPGEIDKVDSIAVSFSNYTPMAEAFIEDANHNNINVYLNNLQPQVWTIQNRVNNLLTMNQEKLLETATLLEKSPYRTILPGLIVVISSILFSIIFNYMIFYYLIRPIIKITRSINEFVKYKKPFEVTIETKDELNDLKESVKNLITTKNIQKN